MSGDRRRRRGHSFGRRRLNGPQTTGRAFRELSEPRHRLTAELDQPVEVRDGTRLLADVFRPAATGERFPALLAFSAYPRQLQQSGAPMGFVEAGSTEFWVSRGYAHVIAEAGRRTPPSTCSGFGSSSGGGKSPL